MTRTTDASGVEPETREPAAPARAQPAPAASAHPELDETGVELRLAVMRLARRLRLERAESELSPAQFSALGWICGAHTAAATDPRAALPLSIGRLSELERVSAPSMNRTVNCLVEAGLAERSACADDGRRVLVTATPRGAEIVRETRARRDAWISHRFAELTLEERATLARATGILSKLAAQ